MPLPHQPTTLILGHILSLIHREMAPMKPRRTGSELIWFKTFNDLYLFQCEGHNLETKTKTKNNPPTLLFILPNKVYSGKHSWQITYFPKYYFSKHFIVAEQSFNLRK